MKQIAGLSAAAAYLALACAISPARGQTPAEYAQTAAFAAAHQNKDGGFAGKVGEPSSLGATNSALKILLHVGGSVPDVLRSIKFVKSCRDEGGGFAQTPGGKPDVVTTAIGLMAAAELKIADSAMIKAATEFLRKNAKSFEEVRMAIAGLEGARASSPDFPRWHAQLQSMRNPDGTFGEGPGQAYATGGAAAAILRMGLELDKRDRVVAAVKAGQRPEGGWSKDAGPPDLGATYRVMRALYMLREKPDVEKLFSFIARCRRSDGSYASTPGGTGDLGGTYTATIVVRWLRLLDGLRPVVETAGFTPLVSGNDLTGWEGDKKLWSVRDGMLFGHSPGISRNEFLATTRPYGDFILSLDFLLVDGRGNSGVQFRSVRVPPNEMSGYQADIGEGYWGSLYDESRRNKVLVSGSDAARKALEPTGWNHYTVRAMGDRITLGLNGATAVNYREPEKDIARSGLIAVQIHAGGPMEVKFKDMMIQSLPSPTTESPTQPGFHLRALRSDHGERKYAVYVPEGYDGTRIFPVILFLHGASQLGEDGVVPAQIGIGPAIANRAGGVPALVVFPQARQTWAAGSADSKAALAALEDVMTSYATDPERVILTGLSMGGRGSWDLASAHPERFAAVVPICGPGRPEQAARIKELPVWSFCGDADRDTTVLNMRAMIEALQNIGAKARLTEYRGVGHNSWDRAYNDPELFDWMLAQRKANGTTSSR
jgi:pimeloyl-ACP methyl ester carboxylesterase/prenyltransferase beta subunit